jgi:tetratricopeptide (TPR) repeat protein
MDFKEEADVDEEIISVINDSYDLDETYWLISLIAEKIIIVEKVEGHKRILMQIQQDGQSVIIDDEIDNIGSLLRGLGESLEANICSWRITKEQFTHPSGLAVNCDVSDKTWQEKLLLSYGVRFTWSETFGEQINSGKLLYDSINIGDEAGVRQALARNKARIKDRRRFTRHAFFSTITPLMFALTVEEPSFAIIKFLIAEGANLTEKVGRPAVCALDIITRRYGSNGEILELLQNRTDAVDISRWYVNLGKRAEKVQGRVEAVKHYKMAHEINPENIFALSKLTLIYGKQGKIARAKTWFEKTTGALERHKGKIEASFWYNLGMYFFIIKDYAAAIQKCQLALKSPVIGTAEEIKDKRRDMHFYCGWAYYETGDYSRALKYYKETKRFVFASDDADFRRELENKMADVYKQLGDDKKAEKHAVEAQRISDGNSGAFKKNFCV